MQPSGQTIIGQRSFIAQGVAVQAFAAATGEPLGPTFGASTLEDVKQACTLEEQAFDPFRSLPGTSTGQPMLFRTTFAQFSAQPRLAEENFGPSALLVVCDSLEQLHTALASLEGQLTTTLHTGPGDEATVRALLPRMERKCGRILFNDFPTGVEVCNTMVHGGPFPATSDNRSTSVGTDAIERFLRPVCYQNVPEEFLPPALHRANPHGIWRLVNGTPSQE